MPPTPRFVPAWIPGNICWLSMANLQSPKCPRQRSHDNQIGRIFGLAGENGRESVADGCDYGYPGRCMPMAGQDQHTESAEAPDRQPVNAKSPLVRSQCCRQSDRQRRERPDLGIKAGGAATLDLGRPCQEFAVTGAVGNEHEIRTEEVAGVITSARGAFDDESAIRQAARLPPPTILHGIRRTEGHSAVSQRFAFRRIWPKELDASHVPKKL